MIHLYWHAKINFCWVEKKFSSTDNFVQEAKNYLENLELFHSVSWWCPCKLRSADNNSWIRIEDTHGTWQTTKKQVINVDIRYVLMKIAKSIRECLKVHIISIKYFIWYFSKIETQENASAFDKSRMIRITQPLPVNGAWNI